MTRRGKFFRSTQAFPVKGLALQSRWWTWPAPCGAKNTCFAPGDDNPCYSSGLEKLNIAGKKEDSTQGSVRGITAISLWDLRKLCTFWRFLIHWFALSQKQLDVTLHTHTQKKKTYLLTRVFQSDFWIFIIWINILGTQQYCWWFNWKGPWFSNKTYVSDTLKKQLQSQLFPMKILKISLYKLYMFTHYNSKISHFSKKFQKVLNFRPDTLDRMAAGWLAKWMHASTSHDLDQHKLPPCVFHKNASWQKKEIYSPLNPPRRSRVG